MFLCVFSGQYYKISRLKKLLVQGLKLITMKEYFWNIFF